jgi:hypothetical protein
MDLKLAPPCMAMLAFQYGRLDSTFCLAVAEVYAHAKQMQQRVSPDNVAYLLANYSDLELLRLRPLARVLYGEFGAEEARTVCQEYPYEALALLLRGGFP